MTTTATFYCEIARRVITRPYVLRPSEPTPWRAYWERDYASRLAMRDDYALRGFYGPGGSVSYQCGDCLDAPDLLPVGSVSCAQATHGVRGGVLTLTPREFHP